MKVEVTASAFRCATSHDVLRRRDEPASYFIDGRRVDASRTIPVVDPATAETISHIGAGDAAAVDLAVASARAAFEDRKGWRGLGPDAREALLLNLAAAIQDESRLLAELETLDVGMPLWVARDLDIPAAVSAIRYMAGWPTKIGGRVPEVALPMPGSSALGFTVREPVGVVGAIIPWNVPLMMAAWKIAPALAAGCTVVLKPSEDASLTCLMLAELAVRAGFPPGVVNVVTGRGDEAGIALVDHPAVAKISFTGSTHTGREIQRRAADTVKRLTLELGGKSPTLIFADAPVERAIVGAADSIFLNSGQTCVAGSRLYVHESLYERVVAGLVEHADRLVIGPGLAPTTQIGPLVSRAQKSRVESYVTDSVAAGAERLTRADPFESNGFFVRPTILARVPRDAPVNREEVFGPVLTVASFRSLDEAIDLANDTPYGLAAHVWTQDIGTIGAVIRRLHCGKIAFNGDAVPVPSLPEGGCKASGFGRDLGPESVDQHLDVKSVLIRTA